MNAWLPRHSRWWYALWRARGRLFPESIGQNRDPLGLRQRDLEGMLGVAEAALSRGKTGAQILERNARWINRRMRLVFASESVREALPDEEGPKRLGGTVGNHDVSVRSASGERSETSLLKPAVVRSPV